MYLVIIVAITALGTLLGIGGLAYASNQKSKFASPFLHKYPIGHPMSPIPDLELVRRHADRLFRSGVAEIPGVDLRGDAQLALLAELAAFRETMPLRDEAGEGRRYRFKNVFFTGTDAILLSHLLRRFKPRRVVEIGSGFSSAAMLDTREAFPEIGTAFTFIEPFPQRLLSLLKEEDKKTCVIIEKSLLDIELSRFTDLEANDMIFMDSSHQVKIGSEVCFLLFEILPRLKPGVLVHFHDVFWPFEYPREWVEIGRAWNEAYALRAFLQYNDGFEILFFNSYMGNVHSKAVHEVMPFGDADGGPWPGGSFMAGGSLWLRRK